VRKAQDIAGKAADDIARYGSSILREEPMVVGLPLPLRVAMLSPQPKQNRHRRAVRTRKGRGAESASTLGVGIDPPTGCHQAVSVVATFYLGLRVSPRIFARSQTPGRVGCSVG